MQLLLAFTSILLVFLFENRHIGLGFFDSSEYALHIRSGGIAHAPGYPLYILLGKLMYGFFGDPFLAQQIISLLSIPIVLISLYKTFETSENSAGRTVHRNAFILTALLFISSFYFKLFTIIPEVFLLNLAIFSLLFYRIVEWYYRPSKLNILLVMLIFGLGVSHHHTLALTLPGFFWLTFYSYRINRKTTPTFNYDWKKLFLPGILGLLLGCTPLVYLFIASHDLSSAHPFNYYQIDGLRSFLFVLLRRGYGTFSLISSSMEVNYLSLATFCLKTVMIHFNYIGLVFFVPLVFWKKFQILPVSDNPISKKKMPFNGHNDPSNSWKQAFLQSPEQMLAFITIISFFIVFISGDNLSLENQTYRLTQIRMLTVPLFLVNYFIYGSSKLFLNWSSAKFKQFKKIIFPFLVSIVLLSNLIHIKQLRYSSFHFLDDHIRWSYETIFSRAQPSVSPISPDHYRCAIFVEGDTLLYSLQYYNQFISEKKCFIISPASIFSTQFQSYYESKLLKSFYGNSIPDSIEANQSNLLPLLHQFSEKLKANDYKLFLLYTPDKRLFYNSRFSFRPLDNLLEVVNDRDPPGSLELVEANISRFLERLVPTLNSLDPKKLPADIIDSIAMTAYTQNIYEYLLFCDLYRQQQKIIRPELVLKLELAKQQINQILDNP